MGRMRRILRAGGLAAGVLLVAPGAVWAWMGATARGEVRDTIVQEQITGSPGMSPATFGESDIVDELPACDVAEKPIDADERARCLAEWMRVHALHSTDGRTNAEMEHFLDDQGREVFTEEEAATNPETGRPVENPARQVWVSQRAPRGSSWPTSASRVSLLSIATGALFILIGAGFVVMLLAGNVLGRPGGGPASGGEGRTGT